VIYNNSKLTKKFSDHYVSDRRCNSGSKQVKPRGLRCISIWSND